MPIRATAPPFGSGNPVVVEEVEEPLRPRLMRSKRSRSTAITFEVASFEYLRTGESDVLLRLEGAWLAGRERGVPGIELKLTGGERSIVLDPLPDPSNFPVAATPSGMPWRAAFPASLEVISDP